MVRELLFALLLLAGPAAQAYPYCVDLIAVENRAARPLEAVENPTLRSLLLSIKTFALEYRPSIVNLIKSEMLKESETTKTHVRAQMKKGRGYKTGTVIIGMGQHSAIFRLQLTAMGISSLALEAGRTASSGVFGDTGASFNTNSENHEDRVSNVLHGSNFRIWDFSHELFPAAEVFGYNAIVAHAQAKGRVLFDSQAEEVIDGKAWGVPITAQWPARYKIITADGLEIFADHVVVATGLGRSQLKTDSEALLKFIDEHRKIPVGPGLAPGIQYLEDFNVFVAFTYQRTKRSALSPYEGLDGVVVGSGHGADTVVEAMAGKADPIIYAGSDPLILKARSLLWMNQKAKNSLELVASVPKRYKGRLDGVLERDDFTFTPDRLKNIRRVTILGVEKFELTTDKDQVFYKDFVILPTGYRGVAGHLLAGLVPGTSTVNFPGIIGQIPRMDEITVVARRAVPVGMPADYDGPMIIGAAASVEGKMVVGEEQLIGNTGEHSINFLNKRTRDAARQFIDKYYPSAKIRNP
ncbi:MAG: hypothetical protein ABL958_00905 [Bdellovibrionia bacterium]